MGATPKISRNVPHINPCPFLFFYFIFFSYPTHFGACFFKTRTVSLVTRSPDGIAAASFHFKRGVDKNTLAGSSFIHRTKREREREYSVEEEHLPNASEMNPMVFLCCCCRFCWSSRYGTGLRRRRRQWKPREMPRFMGPSFQSCAGPKENHLLHVIRTNDVGL